MDEFIKKGVERLASDFGEDETESNKRHGRDLLSNLVAATLSEGRSAPEEEGRKESVFTFDDLKGWVLTQYLRSISSHSDTLRLGIYSYTSSLDTR
jgi:hypothetical protein